MIKGVIDGTVYLYSSRTFKCYAGKVTIVNFGKYDEARFEGVDSDGLRLSAVCSPRAGTVLKSTLWLFERNHKRAKTLFVDHYASKQVEYEAKIARQQQRIDEIHNRNFT